MALKDLSLVSYNSNGFGAGKPEYVKHLLSKHDFVLIQEHWLQEGQFDVLNIQSSCVHAVSGMDTSDLLHGRGYGGLAILWGKNLSCPVSPIVTLSRRLCAVKISLDSLTLLLFNVYMPCDTLYDQTNLQDFESVPRLVFW